MADLAKKTNKSQIKSELSLKEVNKAISFFAQKFDPYQQDRKQNEKKIKKMNGTVPTIKERIKT